MVSGREDDDESENEFVVKGSGGPFPNYDFNRGVEMEVEEGRKG